MPDLVSSRLALLGLVRMTILGACFASPCVILAEPAASTAEIEPRLLEALTALDEKAASVEDLDARFEQRRYTPLLKKPLVSTGRVRALVGQSRWDTDAPYASVMHIRSDRLEVYYPDQETLEVYPVEQRLGELAASPMPRLSTWAKRFRIERAGRDDLTEVLRDAADAGPSLAVRLTPLDDALIDQVGVIVVVIDRESGLSRAMAWSGAEQGERTAIRFLEIQTNTGLEAESLAIQIVDGSRVVYPLGPIEPGAGRERE